MFANSPSPTQLRSVALPLVSCGLPDVRAVPVTLAELCAAGRAVARGLNGTKEVLQIVEVPHENQPFAPFSEAKLKYSAIFADFFHRITGSGHEAHEAQAITAQVVALIWVSDYVVDDFDLPKEVRIETISSLAKTVEDGVPYEYDFCNELTALSRMTVDLHGRLKAAPAGSGVSAALRQLSTLAIQQIENRPSMQFAEQLGAASFEVIAQIPFAFNRSAPQRIIHAARAFGSIMQIIDDVWDCERDRAHGNPTFVTEASDAAQLKAAISQRIDELRAEMVRPLTASEGARFKALLGLSTGYFVAKEAFKDARRLLKRED